MASQLVAERELRRAQTQRSILDPDGWIGIGLNVYDDVSLLVHRERYYLRLRRAFNQQREEAITALAYEYHHRVKKLYGSKYGSIEPGLDGPTGNAVAGVTIAGNVVTLHSTRGKRVRLRYDSWIKDHEIVKEANRAR